MAPSRLSIGDGCRLAEALSAEDYELAFSVLYRHLLLHHYDCSWCDLLAFGDYMNSEDCKSLLLWGQGMDDADKNRRRGLNTYNEDRFDFTTTPPLRPTVRLRRFYCKSPRGMVGSVWCDRIYEYLVSRGCLEHVGINIAEVEENVPRPLQLAASLPIQAVLENDYRFDVIPFHKHGLLRETVRHDVVVPACTPGRVSSKSFSSSSLSFLPPPTYLATTKLGVTTKGWTDVGTTVSAFRPQGAKGRPCQTSQGRVYRPDYALHVFIREQPVYTLVFRGVTNCIDLDSSRRGVCHSAAISTQHPELVATRYLPGICCAAGAIYRQRLPDSSPVLVYRFHELIGKHSDANLGGYVALRIGLKRCLENGYTPAILQSDNLFLMEHLASPAGFVRTLGNYLQEDLHRVVTKMIDELVERNHYHQEALLAATTVKYVNKDQVRDRLLPGVSFEPISTADVRAEVEEESNIGLEKGAMLDRGWASNTY